MSKHKSAKIWRVGDKCRRYSSARLLRMADEGMVKHDLQNWTICLKTEQVDFHWQIGEDYIRVVHWSIFVDPTRLSPMPGELMDPTNPLKKFRFNPTHGQLWIICVNGVLVAAIRIRPFSVDASQLDWEEVAIAIARRSNVTEDNSGLNE